MCPQNKKEWVLKDIIIYSDAIVDEIITNTRKFNCKKHLQSSNVRSGILCKETSL